MMISRRLGLDDSVPWWFCTVCFGYWHPSLARSGGNEADANDDQGASGVEARRLRVPMRNKLEGYYTKWHEDLGFVHLRPALVQQYPDLTTLPSTEEVLEYRQRWELYVAKRRAAQCKK